MVVCIRILYQLILKCPFIFYKLLLSLSKMSSITIIILINSPMIKNTTNITLITGINEIINN